MLYFLQPILLWASAAILVPILIHLWNIREGKTLKVGSIVLLRETAKSSARSFKLTNLLLLLLRCLLLLVLAMLLAKGAWQTKNGKQEKGWLLIPPGGVTMAYRQYKPLIDSLLKTGYVLHHFDSGFAEVKLPDASKEDTTTSSTASYPVLLKQLAAKKSSAQLVYLFTDAKMQHWAGSRPELSFPVRWKPYRESDSAASWIASAFTTNSDSVRIISGESNESYTKFLHQNLSLRDNNTGFQLQSRNGNLFVKNVNGKSEKEVDRGVIRVGIYANKSAIDAAYLTAALNAIKDFSQHRIEIKTISNKTEIGNNINWLFWLSDEEIPAAFLTSNVLIYENGKVRNRNTFLNTNSEVTTGNDKLSVYKTVANDSAVTPSKVLWRDGFGNPVLALQKGEKNIYHFYSRFHPQWNDLVWASSFPQLIDHLLFDDDNSEQASYDKRVTDTAQIAALFNHSGTPVAERNHLETTDLSNLFWSLTFILFLTERILSFYSKRQTA